MTAFGFIIWFSFTLLSFCVWFNVLVSQRSVLTKWAYSGLGLSVNCAVLLTLMLQFESLDAWTSFVLYIPWICLYIASLAIATLTALRQKH